jgi:Raf kinase inhibitor-like YbhB/YbcL family protein
MRWPSRIPRSGSARRRRRGASWLAAGSWLLASALGALAGGSASLSITSSAFPARGEIPRRFTCDGAGASPPLSWSGVPRGVRSLALVVDDPDAPDPKAPRTTWTHWILYDIPASATHLPEAVTAAELPAGTRQGLNGWQREGYGGPCPPIGRHRYFFHLYALDQPLGALPHPDRASLLKALEGHVLASADLVGTYQRSR